MQATNLLLAVAACFLGQTGQAQPTAQPVVLNDDGAWCWFQDERAIIDGSRLLVGSVASGRHDPARTGDIDVVAYDLNCGAASRIELHDRLELDDHAAPALFRRADGQILAIYSKHGSENCFYMRRTERADDVLQWTPPTRVTPSDRSRVTYSNLLFVADENAGRGRLYNFFRGLDASFKPSYSWSDDLGDSWQTGHVVIDVPSKFRHRPYVKYAGNGRDSVHLLYTDGHPRDFDNSVYHVVYRAGVLSKADGTKLAPLTDGLRRPEQGAQVFAGEAQNVAWVSDLHLSPEGWPVGVFSVQKDSGGLKSSDPRAGQDHRYYYAAWDGMSWNCHEIAYGGTRLYAGEDDYTGNICLDPNRLNTVYFSTNADPRTGRPLISSADDKRHYELFRGTTYDGGMTWNFSAITQNSAQDNLRPIVPAWDRKHVAILWFRGAYRTYRDYETEVVGLFESNPP